MRHRGRTRVGHSVRAARRSLRLEQLETRQMLAGNAVSSAVSAGWFATGLSGDQVRHAAPASIVADDASMTAARSGAAAAGQLDWIVQFDTSSVSGMSGPAETGRLLPQGGVQFQVISGLGAVGEVLVRSYGATAAQASAALRADSDVAWFQSDTLQGAAAVPNDTQFSRLWALKNSGQEGGAANADIRATDAWNITTGSRGVVVAVIDSGIDYTHPDLAANLWTNPNAGRDGFGNDLHGYNFVDDNGNPMDNNGHGTHVAGTIGAAGNNGSGVTGVNWSVSIMALKTLDAKGGGYASDSVRAINYAVMQRTQYGVNVRVINASWSSTAADEAVSAAVRAAGEAGILVVAAAGNSAANTDQRPEYPASSGLANVVSVAASDGFDRLASFSNYGATSVSLAAPGIDIYSTLPGGGYGYRSGTSMATPEVAGVAALAWAAYPNATVAQVRTALLQGVDKLGTLAGKVVSGGRLNALGTLQILAGAVAPAPAPTPAVAPTVGSLTASAASVQSGDNLTLVAGNLSAADGAVASVSFYCDSNGNAQWDAADRLLGSSSPVAGQASFTLSTADYAAGTHRFFARAVGTNGLTSSAVSTQVAVAAKAAQGTNPATATSVALGSTVQGSIASAAGANFYKVELAAGQKYTFQVALGSLYDSVLTLLGSNSQTLAQNDDVAIGNRASSITWLATSSGTHYLAVGSYPGTPVGSFSLSAGLAPGSASLPVAGQSPSLAAIGNQSVAAGSSLTVALFGRDPSGTALTYLASSGNGAVTLTVSGNRLTMKAAANYTGNVQIVVTATNGAGYAVRSFTLAVTRANSAARQLGRNVAFPSATLRPAAAAAALPIHIQGAATGSASNSSRGLDPAALDTLFRVLGKP